MNPSMNTAIGNTGATMPGPRSRWTVARGQSVCVPSPLGQCVACEAGTLWLTFDGDRRDIVLEAGERHVCDTDARLIVHALSAGALRLG